MEYKEEDYLQLSGIQHYAFCRRQWALIHIEQAWEENLRTVEGDIVHDKCHDGFSSESRRDLVISRGMPVFSRELGISGECDVVELRRSADGVSLRGREGLYRICPVEYKRGEPKDEDIDILQLAAQAFCLEEMLGCTVDEGAIFYDAIKRRQRVEITAELREKLRRLTAEMHVCYERGNVPKVKPTKACNACSLKNLCLPKLLKASSARAYLDENLGAEVKKP